MAQYAAEHPLRPGGDNITGRVALEGKAVHIHDVLADPEYRQTGYQQAFGYRTISACRSCVTARRLACSRLFATRSTHLPRSRSSW